MHVGTEILIFFHACATQRYRKNRIVEIKDKQSVLREDQWGIQDAFQQNFQEVYTSNQPTDEEIKQGVESLEQKVSMK